MTDIVERLRERHANPHRRFFAEWEDTGMAKEAADEIERLRGEIKEYEGLMREATEKLHEYAAKSPLYP